MTLAQKETHLLFSYVCRHFRNFFWLVWLFFNKLSMKRIPAGFSISIRSQIAAVLLLKVDAVDSALLKNHRPQQARQPIWRTLPFNSIDKEIYTNNDTIGRFGSHLLFIQRTVQKEITYQEDSFDIVAFYLSASHCRRTRVIAGAYDLQPWKQTLKRTQELLVVARLMF